MNIQQDEGSWREIYFTPEQWANVPAAASLWHGTAPDPEAEQRLRTAEEIALVVHGIMVAVLTPRQRRVMELYYLENCTQVEVATALGISQATVSQHLKGKRRNGHNVGGAFRKMRGPWRHAGQAHFEVPGRHGVARNSG